MPHRSCWALSPCPLRMGHWPTSSMLFFPTVSEWMGSCPGQTAVGWYPFLAHAVARSLIIYVLRLCSREGLHTQQIVHHPEGRTYHTSCSLDSFEREEEKGWGFFVKRTFFFKSALSSQNTIMYSAHCVELMLTASLATSPLSLTEATLRANCPEESRLKQRLPSLPLHCRSSLMSGLLPQ